MEETKEKGNIQNDSNYVFLQQLSTEIRSALSGIVAVTDELKNSLAEKDVFLDQLKEIEENSDAIYHIANSIIDYTDMAQEKLQLVNAPFSVKTLMSNVLTQFDAYANRKNVHLFTNVRDVEEVQLNGDRARFEQIVKGYIEYALDHSAKEGNVFIILRYKYLTRNTMQVIVEMETAGTGMYYAIAKDYAFLREKKYQEHRYGGKGINLYICNRLLEKMGGTITYSSKNEFESRLSLSFDMETIQVTTPEEKKHFTFDNEKLIMIDVDNEWKEINRSFFDDIGIQHQVFQDFEEAMDSIGEAEDEKEPYGICLMKWNASQKDTMEMVNEIRSVFGNTMILMALTADESIGVEINKVEGLNYVVSQSWIRSLIFDTLVKRKKGEFDQFHSAYEKKYNFENRRVLLAEDVLLNAELVIRMLNNVNIIVTEAVNGLEAVSIYNKKPEGYFNCILMDINMPVMDGYSATKEIRNSGKADAKTVPIFAMTANAMAEDIQQAIDVGMDGHIAKPVEVDKLYSLLNKTFSAMENDQFIDLKKQADELKKKNDELQRKAEHDHLTGLLNRHGFERKVEAYSKSEEPIGLMLIDLDKFKGINDTYGHQIGDQVLHKLAVTLQKYFRATDDIIRFGGDEFAVILTQLSADRSFVVKNIGDINIELSNPQDGLPPFSISTGVAFSENGYSQELYAKADEALYIIKENGRCGCKIYSETEPAVTKVKSNKKKISHTMLYLEEDEGRLVAEKETLLSAVLEANSAVGTACGFYNEQRSTYFVSKYMLVQLGYTFEEFMDLTSGEFKMLLCPYDRLCIYEIEEAGKVYTSIVRLLHKSGEMVWFRVSIINSYASDGRKVWIGSFRKIDTTIVKELCESNSVVVGIISCIDQKIIFEKGADALKGYAVEKDMRYDYDTLLRFSIDKQIAMDEREDIYQKSCLKNIIKNLGQEDNYSFITKRMVLGEQKEKVKYRFRYIDYQQDAIVCTQEFLQ